MASLTFTHIEYRDPKVARLVRAAELSIKLLECRCRPEAVATALKNALTDFHQPARKPAQGERFHGNRTAS